MKKRWYRFYGATDSEMQTIRGMIDADDITFITIAKDENDEWYILVPITFWALVKWKVVFFIENIRKKTKYRLVKDKS